MSIDRATPGLPKRILRITGAIVRILLGFMFIMTGRLWLTREDPAGYLVAAVQGALDIGRVPGFYVPLARDVVLPHAGVVAVLAGLGELAVGVSLLLGVLARLGAAGGVFLMLNYSLALGNSFVPPLGNPMLALVLLALYASAAGRAVGVDEWLRVRLSRSRWLDLVT